LGAALDRASAEYATLNSPQAKAEAKADELKRSIQTPEQRLEKELEEDPTRVGLYLQLADIHKSYNRLDDAEKVLARGRKAVPDDGVLKSAHGDIQLMRLRRAIDSFMKRVKEHPEDQEAKEKLAQLREKLSSYELAEIRRRVEQQPEDSALHLQFGKLLAIAGKHDEAIGAFQKARANADLKPAALHQAGLSFEAKGLAKLAEKNFIEALALADAGDMVLRNALRYRLGRVCEAQNKLKEAEDYYNEVAAEDYTYLDVAQRLQDLNERADS
jgi:tetratricopeptide (TPR) repeat protein